MEILAKILSSKTSIAILFILILALGLGLAWNIKTHSLENKIEELKKTVDNQNVVIVNLEQELKLTKFELDTVQKGLLALEDFNSKQKEILDDEDQTKTEIMDVVNQSEEVQDWWSSSVPSDLLDALCQ